MTIKFFKTNPKATQITIYSAHVYEGGRVWPSKGTFSQRKLKEALELMGLEGFAYRQSTGLTWHGRAVEWEVR